MRIAKTTNLKKDLWTDQEVYAALNNATIALYRWKRLQPVLADRPQRLMAFAKAIVGLIREAVTDLQAPRDGLEAIPVQILSNEEIMLCLQIAQCVITGEFSEENPMRSAFLGLVTSAVKRLDGKLEPEVEELAV